MCDVHICARDGSACVILIVVVYILFYAGDMASENELCLPIFQQHPKQILVQNRHRQPPYPRHAVRHTTTTEQLIT